MQKRHLYHKLHVGLLTPYPIIDSWNLSLFENLKNRIYLLIMLFIVRKRWLRCYIQERDQDKLFFRNTKRSKNGNFLSFWSDFLNFDGLNHISDPGWRKTSPEHRLQGCSKTIGLLEIQRRSPDRRRSWRKRRKSTRTPRKVQNTIFLLTIPKLGLIDLNNCTKQIDRKFKRNCSSNISRFIM